MSTHMMCQVGGPELRSALMKEVTEFDRNGIILADSPLTDLGEEQAKGLRSNTQLRSRLQLVIASTMRRALDTARLGYGDLVQKGNVRAVVLDDAREYISTMKSDRRSSTIQHKQRCKEFNRGWDFGQVCGLLLWCSWMDVLFSFCQSH